MGIVSKSFFILAWKIPRNVIYLNGPFSRILKPKLRKEFCTIHYMKCYEILGVPNSSDQETVRHAFLELVKKYHPDSGSPEANKDKFHEIESAYRTLQEKFASERRNTNSGMGEYGLYYKENTEVQEYDIKHTAPQHRQYLSYEGFGSGTPQQREKQYQKKRARAAVENLHNYRISKISSTEDVMVLQNKKEAKKIKTRSEMDRLVEDLIQESIARGDFDNLSGSGKPLKQQVTNPYVDFVTYKMNQMLIDNGFAPEWITLQKEINSEIRNIQDQLAYRRTFLGPQPLTEEEQFQWEKDLEELKPQINDLNKKINTFNLQVPLLNKQMMFFPLEKEAAKLLGKGKTKYDVPSQQEKIPKELPNSTPDLGIGLLLDILFKRK